MLKCTKKLNILVIVVLCVLLCTFYGCNKESEEYYYAFGTQIVIKLSGKSTKKVQSNLCDLYNAEDKDFDAENTTGSIYKLNNAKANEVVEVSSDVYNMLKLAKEMYVETNGVFNIATYNMSKLWKFTSDTYTVIDTAYTPPTNEEIEETLLKCNFDDIVLLSDNKVKKLSDDVAVGLGAIAKGYAGDKSFEYISDESGILNIGGTIFTVGDDTYNIGITSPRETSASYFGKLTIGGNAVCCTSGDYERYYENAGTRYCHILGRDGYPINNGITSVTILSTDRTKVSGAMCDILSTSIFALGRTDGLKLAGKYGVGVVIIYDDNTYELYNISDGVFTLKDTSYTVKNV